MQIVTSLNEETRLAAVEDYSVSVSSVSAGAAPPDFDDFALLAAQICKAPIGILSFVEAERVSFKAKIGLTLSGLPRAESFCTYAIEQSDIFIVCDALDDERFLRSRLVTLDPYVRFYAGVPLWTSGGKALGVLGVMDHTRRSLGRGQREGLRALARQAMRQLELRRDLGVYQRNRGLVSFAAEEEIAAPPSSSAERSLDALTRLPDQYAFKKLLAEALVRPPSDGAAACADSSHTTAPLDEPSPQVALMFVNLDRFRVINETLGFEAGDCLLRQVGARLRNCLGERDVVARFGSDEFALALRLTGDADEAELAARKILDALGLPFVVNDQELFITASIGISVSPFDGKDVSALLKSGGIALKRAKEEEGPSYQLYTSGRTTKALKELVLESSLRRGVEREEFRLFYQPQLNLHSGLVVGVEALVRWEHPELGFLPPTEFIPLAEENGMIVRLGEWILRTACAQNKAWQQAGYAPLRMSINLSARQFQQPNLVEMIVNILQETALDAHHLELELTESSIMPNAEQAIKKLCELKEMGLQLSIDDFGTGYSSLNYLKRFPIDTLKIDQSFVRDISTDPDDASIVRAIITLAHSLKLNVIAEGVETAEQFTYLRQLRCDEMQGYWFSYPLDAREIEAIIIERQRAIDAGDK